MGKQKFLFNIDWRDVLMDYPAEVRLEVYEAIIEYASSGTLIEMKPLAQMAFSFIKRELDFDKQKYDDACAAKRENGKKGGRPRKENQEKPNAFLENQEKPKKPDNDNDYDYDYILLAQNNAHTWQKISDSFQSSTRWKESVMRNYQLSEKDITAILAQLVAYCSISVIEQPNKQTFARLFPKQVELFRKQPQEDLDNRLQKFIEEIAQEKKRCGYDSDSCNMFYNYWSQLGSSDKMRFEDAQYWDTAKQLAIWILRDNRAQA